MEIELVLFNSGRSKSFFELESGKRSWDIILLITKGSFTLTLNKIGKTQVFHPYEIAHIPANTEFIRSVTEPIDFHQFAFRRIGDDIAFDALTDSRLKLPPKHAQSIAEDADILSFSPKQDDAVINLIRHILFENYIWSGISPKASRPLSREISTVIKYMNEHIAEKINIDELASSVYLSHTGLIWKFKNELGSTPSEYLSMLRMLLAKQLLLENSAPIGEIAERCGYANAYYFSNTFRRVIGVSPSKYRKDNIS